MFVSSASQWGRIDEEGSKAHANLELGAPKSFKIHKTNLNWALFRSAAYSAAPDENYTVNFILDTVVKGNQSRLQSMTREDCTLAFEHRA